MGITVVKIKGLSQSQYFPGNFNTEEEVESGKKGYFGKEYPSAAFGNAHCDEF